MEEDPHPTLFVVYGTVSAVISKKPKVNALVSKNSPNASVPEAKSVVLNFPPTLRSVGITVPSFVKAVAANLAYQFTVLTLNYVSAYYERIT